MKRRNTLMLLVTLFVLGQTAKAQPFLEIHHIGAGDGDATLILMVDKVGELIDETPIWDTCAILIDAQRPGKGGNEVWRYVHDTISNRFPERLTLDFIVLSHLHYDHYGGLTNLISSAAGSGWSIGSVITSTNVPSTIDPSVDLSYECFFEEVQTPKQSASATAFLKVVRENAKEINVRPGDSLLKTRGFETISMECVVGMGYYFTGSEYACFLPAASPGSEYSFKARSQNDLSYGFLISFQGFNYLTLGDLGGETDGSYVDGETPVTNYLKNVRFDGAHGYHMCGLKASHHGSRHSSSETFALTNNPTVSVFEAALRSYGSSPYALPTQQAITNLRKADDANLLFTFIPGGNPQTISNYWKKKNLKYYNDVVLKISSSPGYGNIAMRTIQRQKTTDFSSYAQPTITTISCKKDHSWSNPVME